MQKYETKYFSGNFEIKDREKTVVFSEDTRNGSVGFCEVNGDLAILDYDCRKGSIDVFYKDGIYIGIEKDNNSIVSIYIGADGRFGQARLNGALYPAMSCDIEHVRLAALKGSEESLKHCKIAGSPVQWRNGNEA